MAIGDLCEVVNGGTPKTGVDEYWNGEHLWITPAEMGKRESPYVSDTERKISGQGLRNSSARLLPPYSVVLSSRAPIGHLVINTEPMATNQGCKGLVPGPLIDHKYLFYYLSSIVDLLNALGTGATFKELSGGKLKEVAVPVPPLPEQKRIVAILDEAFEGIRIATANAKKNLANARELFERTVGEAIFGDADLKGWRTALVSELAASAAGSIRTGPFGSQLLHSEFVDSGVAVLGIDNAVSNEFRWAKRRYISNEKYQQLSRYRVRPGDVIITIMGTCGRCAIVPDDIPLAINTKHLCCITLDRAKCVPEFLHAYFLYHPMARSYLAARSKGAIMEGLNMGIIKEMPVRYPTIAEQATIAGRIDDLRTGVDHLNLAYRERMANYTRLGQSILTRAFAGALTAAKGLAA